MKERPSEELRNIGLHVFRDYPVVKILKCLTQRVLVTLDPCPVPRSGIQ